MRVRGGGDGDVDGAGEGAPPASHIARQGGRVGHGDDDVDRGSDRITQCLIVSDTV